MKFISNNNITDPTLNLAMEEYVLKNLPAEESYFLFYINRPSIIVGKNQNTIEEVNQTYIDAHNIDVVRRISGGGAVYHDTGNLNFSFITDDDGNSFHNFQKFTEKRVVFDLQINLAVGDLNVLSCQLFQPNNLHFSSYHLVQHNYFLIKRPYLQLLLSL